MNKKVVFFYDKYVNSTIMVDSFIEILLVLEFQLTKFVVGTFSYKAHFRLQISSKVSNYLNNDLYQTLHELCYHNVNLI